ncbi:MAG: type II toxin-antitoxin system HicB family antitoxin [Clostridiales bacterium]|nr:type II toxin-antitoxin system HicB family antitoxin [Clostridiales bacterium]MCD8383266.1 type II toxin-antitoxin system HicB family antitoxin [Clostridiales bacterium]
MKLTYPAVFEPLGDAPGYTVTVPDLPGCVTEGDSLADAIIMAEDAASGWVLDELEDGKQPPKASELAAVHTENGQFVSLLALDMDRYAEKYGAKAVRKNVTIPAWLNTYAESLNLNFSKVLQDALQELYQTT